MQFGTHNKIKGANVVFSFFGGPCWSTFPSFLSLRSPSDTPSLLVFSQGISFICWTHSESVSKGVAARCLYWQDLASQSGRRRSISLITPSFNCAQMLNEGVCRCVTLNEGQPWQGREAKHHCVILILSHLLFTFQRTHCHSGMTSDVMLVKNRFTSNEVKKIVRDQRGISVKWHHSVPQLQETNQQQTMKQSRRVHLKHLPTHTILLVLFYL